MKTGRLNIDKLSSKVFVPLIAVIALTIGYVGSSAYAKRNIAPAVACQDVCISILKDGFSKSEVAVKVGTFIEFVEADGQMHNLALGSGIEAHGDTSGHEEDVSHTTNEKHNDEHEHVSGTESGEFGKGEAWRVQFKQKGTYIVHDHLHPESSILVVAY